jgi:hypothetical protein
MPRGVIYGSWEKENTDWAPDALRDRNMGQNAVAQTYFLLKPTLKRTYCGLFTESQNSEDIRERERL